MTAAVLHFAGEVVDFEGYRWVHDTAAETWDSPDFGVFGVSTEFLLENRLVAS